VQGIREAGDGRSKNKETGNGIRGERRNTVK
jgi:hypothetical protein